MGLEAIRKGLREKMKGVDGLLSLCLSDKDGVPILQCPLEEARVEPLLRSTYLSMYGTTVDTTDKLNLGKNKVMYMKFDNYQVAHFNHSPVILTLVGTESCMLGEMMDFSKRLEAFIADVANVAMTD